MLYPLGYVLQRSLLHAAALVCAALCNAHISKPHMHPVLLADIPSSKTPFGEPALSSQHPNGVEITEVAATPSGGNSPTGSNSPAPWKPPAIPQSSLNLGKRTKSEASSSA